MSVEGKDGRKETHQGANATMQVRDGALHQGGGDGGGMEFGFWIYSEEEQVKCLGVFYRRCDRTRHIKD